MALVAEGQEATEAHRVLAEAEVVQAQAHLVQVVEDKYVLLGILLRPPPTHHRDLTLELHSCTC